MKKFLCIGGLILCLGSNYYIFNKYNDYKSNLVLEAVLSHNLEVTQFLLEKYDNVNKKYKYGHTLLHCAALSGDFEMVKLLVEKDAQLVKNDFGLSAIDSASDMGHGKIVTYLKQEYNL